MDVHGNDQFVVKVPNAGNTWDQKVGDYALTRLDSDDCRAFHSRHHPQAHRVARGRGQTSITGSLNKEHTMPKENQKPMFEFRFGPIMIKATGLEATLAAFTLAMLTLILAFH